MTGFLNENTLNVLPYAKDFYEGILNALNRSVQVKYLWSLECDERPLLDEQKRNNFIPFEELTKKLKDLYKLSSKIDGFEMRFIQKKNPYLL